MISRWRLGRKSLGGFVRKPVIVGETHGGRPARFPSEPLRQSTISVPNSAFVNPARVRVGPPLRGDIGDRDRADKLAEVLVQLGHAAIETPAYEPCVRQRVLDARQSE